MNGIKFLTIVSPFTTAEEGTDDTYTLQHDRSNATGKLHARTGEKFKSQFSFCALLFIQLEGKPSVKTVEFKKVELLAYNSAFQTYWVCNVLLLLPLVVELSANGAT